MAGICQKKVSAEIFAEFRQEFEVIFFFFDLYGNIFCIFLAVDCDRLIRIKKIRRVEGEVHPASHIGHQRHKKRMVDHVAVIGSKTECREI